MKFKTLVCFCLITLVASLSPVARAQTFSVIHTFTGMGSDGSGPIAGVTLRGGALYGTTYYSGIGGPEGPGTVFQITHVGSNWATVPIFLFPVNLSGGAGPEARVLFGPDGHLYGTAQSGGMYNGGVLFNLTPPLSICKTAGCSWKENILHSFMGPPNDGDNTAYGDVIWDQQGNIYGTTQGGGTANRGTVYQLNPVTETYSVIYDFLGAPDGDEPVSGVIFDQNGNLYGTTNDGGAGYGTVFELANVNGQWVKTALYNFRNADDGGHPVGGLLLDCSGNLYGTTTFAGAGQGGTVFELSPSGNTWTLQTLYSFPGSATCGPQASLTMDAAGNLYGTTLCDGVDGYGSVFKLTKAGNGWVFTSLHDFTGGADSGMPFSPVTIDTDGTLYGTASGAAFGAKYGVVWMIKP